MICVAQDNGWRWSWRWRLGVAQENGHMVT